MAWVCPPVNKDLYILLGALIERKDSKSGTTAAKMLENALVVLDSHLLDAGRGSAIAESVRNVWWCLAREGDLGACEMTRCCARTA